jgi:hypothetical protein
MDSAMCQWTNDGARAPRMVLLRYGNGTGVPLAEHMSIERRRCSWLEKRGSSTRGSASSPAEVRQQSAQRDGPAGGERELGLRLANPNLGLGHTPGTSRPPPYTRNRVGHPWGWRTCRSSWWPRPALPPAETIPSPRCACVVTGTATENRKVRTGYCRRALPSSDHGADPWREQPTCWSQRLRDGPTDRPMCVL